MKKFLYYGLSYLCGNQGNAMVLLLSVILLMFGIGSIGLDFGVMVAKRTRLVSAADASALAGAQELVRASTDGAI